MRARRKARTMAWMISVSAITPSLAGCMGLEPTSASSESDVTAVENTEVKSQPIGNCWLYATAGWAESLYKGATGESVDLSESYWSYWYWYEQILGDASSVTTLKDGKIRAGGWWGAGAELIHRYGWMHETDFVGYGQDESVAKAALRYINASLTEGVLADPAARKDPRIVRAELNTAWNLPPITAVALNVAFPTGAPAASASEIPFGADPATLVRPASALPALSANGASVVTLEDVVGVAAEGTKYWQGIRVGDEAWSTLGYTWTEASSARRRAILKNVQDTLNRRLAVPIDWAIAYGASGGRYTEEIAIPEKTGGLHASLLVDYEVEDVPGFGTLPVGITEERPEALEAALSDQARVTFFRIKNSWGATQYWTEEELIQQGKKDTNPANYGPKATYLPSMPGYNDLELGFLDAVETKYYNGHFAKQFTLPPAHRFAIPKE